jgi:hypothetical protein
MLFFCRKNSYSFTSCSDTVVKNVFENGASLLQIYFNIFLVLDIFSGNTLMNWLASKTIFFLQLTTNYDVIPVKRQINIARVALNKMKNWNIILFNSKNIYLMTKYKYCFQDILTTIQGFDNPKEILWCPGEHSIKCSCICLCVNMSE